MTHKLRGVRVEEYTYYVNILRQNVSLETWIWRQIVTLQAANTKYKWPPYATDRNPPIKIFCVRHCLTVTPLLKKNKTYTYFDKTAWQNASKKSATEGIMLTAVF